MLLALSNNANPPATKAMIREILLKTFPVFVSTGSTTPTRATNQPPSAPCFQKNPPSVSYGGSHFIALPLYPGNVQDQDGGRRPQPYAVRSSSGGDRGACNRSQGTSKAASDIPISGGPVRGHRSRQTPSGSSSRSMVFLLVLLAILRFLRLVLTTALLFRHFLCAISVP